MQTNKNNEVIEKMGEKYNASSLHLLGDNKPICGKLTSDSTQKNNHNQILTRAFNDFIQIKEAINVIKTGGLYSDLDLEFIRTKEGKIIRHFRNSREIVFDIKDPIEETPFSDDFAERFVKGLTEGVVYQEIKQQNKEQNRFQETWNL